MPGLKSETKEFGGISVTVTQFPALRALELATRVAHAFAPALAQGMVPTTGVALLFSGVEPKELRGLVVDRSIKPRRTIRASIVWAAGAGAADAMCCSLLARGAGYFLAVFRPALFFAAAGFGDSATGFVMPRCRAVGFFGFRSG